MVWLIRESFVPTAIKDGELPIFCFSVYLKPGQSYYTAGNRYDERHNDPVRVIFSYVIFL